MIKVNVDTGGDSLKLTTFFKVLANLFYGMIYALNWFLFLISSIFVKDLH